MSSSKNQGDRQSKMLKALLALNPTHCELINESANHNVPKGSETHFKLMVVSQEFVGKTQIERHRRVLSVLSSFLSQGVHALSIEALDPAEWATHHKGSPSPECLGGSDGGSKK